MPSLTKSFRPDRNKIDPQNATELKYWSKALGAPEEDILGAIEKVGNSAAAVRKELSTAKQLKSNDFPLSADGKAVKTQDGSRVAETTDPVVAEDIADRLNADEAQREEDKWSA
jgi:uncharacterized protein DUF3606